VQYLPGDLAPIIQWLTVSMTENIDRGLRSGGFDIACVNFSTGRVVTAKAQDAGASATLAIQRFKLVLP
jgi:hypothetical protein